MAHHLTVQAMFEFEGIRFERGDRIDEPALVEAVQKSHPGHVTRVHARGLIVDEPTPVVDVQPIPDEPVDQ
jgi:hypothetical protein